jgi:predicted dehydrogenase
MDKPLRAAVLGTAHAHAGGKINVLAASPDFDLVGICEPDAQLLGAARDRQLFADLPWLDKAEILGDETIAMVAVEGRVSDNLGLARECLEAGKHIHLDKPPGIYLAEFASLLDLAASRDLIVQAGYMFRYNTAFELSLEAVREGRLGDICYIHGEINSDIPPATRAELGMYPGGMMFELGCHLIDMLIATLGEPHTVTPFLRHDGEYDDDLADNCTAVFEYDRSVAVIHSSAMEVAAQKRRCWEVCGTEGTVIIQPLEPPEIRLCLNSPWGGCEAGWQTVEVEHIPRYVGDMSELAACIRGEQEPSYSPAHDLITQRVVLAASGMAS